MGEPCRQEGKIAALQADRNSMERSLERIEDSQAELISLLRDISTQGEQIKNLVQRFDKTEKDVQSLFKRVREIELAPGKQASALQMYGLTAIISCVVAWIFKRWGG